MLFGGPRAVYGHYFKDIRQGALQSDCVMLFGGVGDDAGRELGMGWLEV